MEPPHAIYNQAGPSNFSGPYSQEGRPPPSYGAGRGRGHPGYRHANANYHQTHQAPFFSPGVAGSYAGYSLGLNGTTGPPPHGQFHAQNSLPPGRRPGPSYHAGNFPAPPSPALHPTHMYNSHSSPYMSPTAVPSPGPMYPYPHAPGHLAPYPAPFSPPIHHPPPSFPSHQNVKSPSTVLADSAASPPKTWKTQQPSSPRTLQVSSTPLPMQQKEAPSPVIPLSPSPPSPPDTDDSPQRAELSASSPSPKSSSPAAEIRTPTLPNTPPSPTISLPSFDSEPAPQQEWVISAIRPGNPAAAFGLTISPKAKPPSHIVKGAQQYINPVRPKASPLEPASVDMPESEKHEAASTGNVSSADGIASQTEQVSCSATETESRTSTVPDTSVAGSPLSTATSVSIAPPKSDNLAKNEAQTVLASEPTEPSISAESPKSSVSAHLPSTVNVESPVSASSVKKSWASLLRSDASSSLKTKLPTSSVQGFSIPAQSTAGPSSLPVSSGPGGKEAELLRLLSNGPTGSSSAPQIRPRGLVNTGNMCFANAVLQTFVYTPLFYRFFTELGNFKGTGATSTEWAGKDAPLVDATVEFLKEFKPKVRDSSKDSYEDDEDYAAIDSFIPSYVYDAMKGKSRFDNMGGGQQEDAEEFFGFFLDSIEEELLAISRSLKDGSRPAGHDRDATDGDDWMEVGRKNKPIVARTVKSADSPMTRIFGGKFRSTLKVPGQRDSVVVEDWRSLKLDIQREQVESIEDALRYISHPQPVQMSSVTKGGAAIEALQQVLVDALPTILVLHLKRFLYDTSARDVIKVHKQVSYGPELEVPSDAISPARRTAHPAKYKLFAVLYHHGTSAAGGHYTLDVLHPNRNADPSAKPREGWIRIDDELVTDLRTEEVFGKERDCAYLLFYRRIAGSYARAGQIARSRVRARVVLPRRCLATATATPGSVSRPSSEPVVPLSNVEAQWEKLSADEQLVVQQQLDELQKKDWKTLSMDEKRAAYYVAFGPHGPRAPVTPAGQPLKIFLAVAFGVSAAGIMSYAIRAAAPPPPKTLTKEWQEAMNERAKEQQMNPISGVSSEGYKGKGFVQ
ncbi:hypothetical protein ACEPAI_5074 [Sanghuangporus weigelae]